MSAADGLRSPALYPVCICGCEMHVQVKNDSEERQDETVSEGTHKQDRVAPFPIVLMSLSEHEEVARSSGRLRQVSTNGKFQGQYETQRVDVP